jgi:hypothetical protein
LAAGSYGPGQPRWSSLGKLPVVPIMPLNEICLGQIEGDGASDSSPHVGSSGLELVPFGEGEPLPLNWSQGVVVDEGGD